jgi:hypothetical protein
MKIYDNIIDKSFEMFGFCRKFTDNDDKYKELKLSDYGLDKYEFLDENLSNIFIYNEIIPKSHGDAVYDKFEAKFFWLDIVKKSNVHIISFSLFILFAIGSLFCYYLLIPMLISFVVSQIYLKKLNKSIISFDMLDFFKENY